MSEIVLEPFWFSYAAHLRQYDMFLVADGGAYPSIEMVQDMGPDPDDEGYVIITLVSQRSLRVPGDLRLAVARKGVNTNQI